MEARRGKSSETVDLTGRDGFSAHPTVCALHFTTSMVAARITFSASAGVTKPTRSCR
jgi:hypothetical protein